MLMVGEAPGYRGAARSGVALASIAILLDSWDDPWDAFGPSKGYIAPRNLSITKESTATMVWNGAATLLAPTPLPLTWNAVPFHPVGAGPDSNRSLRASEVACGGSWLERLMDLFPRSHPVALGNRASDALGSLGVEHLKVRHPSRGGKMQFLAGLGLAAAAWGSLPPEPVGLVARRTARQPR